MHHEAAAVAAIFSRDSLVAEAALFAFVPVHSAHGSRNPRQVRAIVPSDRGTIALPKSAWWGSVLIESRFRAGEIKDLEAQLGGKLSPARLRYRDFLTVVKKLMDRNISDRAFIDEFKEFTFDIAGKLDFGIYSFCLDSLFQVLMCRSLLKSFCRWSFLSIRR